ncbi:P44/Msp2 family outer membrane protein [Anaplasma capra]|nr:P44/Msp2 family outer membrane protein [Anaplasma capra]MCU7611098.1 P44/Msp2 family outer membrane protein [Anaplasma capra]MCU7612398.1 P44/Msp2 family outer membrane protein [Anaplasma capra]
MNYRELLKGGLSATAVCACSLLISGPSLASPMGSDMASSGGGVMGGSFYIGATYSPAFSSITSFDIRESGKETSYVKGYNKSAKTMDVRDPGNFSKSSYSFQFARNLLMSFDGVVGYALGGARVELETSYRRFATLADGTYTQSGAEAIAAVSREAVLTGNNYFVLKIDEIINTSVMFNGCYDVLHADLPVSPYVCAGMGASFVDIARQVTAKLAYRGKVGISYQLTPEISLVAGGFYHGLFDESYKDISPHNNVNFPGEAKAAIKAHVADYGFNLGARFLFS